MALITLRSIKGSPLTITEVDDNFIAINTELGNKLDATSYTAADILTKVKTVDGLSSGLDSDLLRGLSSSSSDTTGNTVVVRNGGNFAAGDISANMLDASEVRTTTISFEGSTVDGNTINLVASDPLVDHTITVPAVTGTLVTTGDTGSITNTMLAGSISNLKLQNSTITIDGNAINLGGTVNVTTGDNTWTGTQTFKDNKFNIVDNADASKKLAFEINGITPSTTRTLTIADANGTIATQEYVTAYVQATSANSQGTKTISTSAPTGGVDGDIWYQV